MKKQELIILAFTGLFVIGFQTIMKAQWGAGLKGNGDVTEELRKVNQFTGIQVDDGLDVYITMGQTHKVVVEADKNIIPHISTTVRNGKLKMEVTQSIRNATKMQIHITVSDLNYIEASSGSDIFSTNLLRLKDLEIESDSGSDISLEIDVDALDIDVSSGSDVKLSGNANEAQLNCSSGSDLKCKALKIKNCTISASSGSDAYVYVTGKVEADASSASDIFLYGNPEIVKQSASSGADIHKK